MDQFSLLSASWALSCGLFLAGDGKLVTQLSPSRERRKERKGSSSDWSRTAPLMAPSATPKHLANASSMEPHVVRQGLPAVSARLISQLHRHNVAFKLFYLRDGQLILPKSNEATLKQFACGFQP